MRIVLALGGNALQSDSKDTSPESQLRNCRETAKFIVDLIEMGHIVVVVHGNGPQVGQIMSSVEEGHMQNPANPLFTSDVCAAFSQGYIGYHLQNSITQELKTRNIRKSVGTIITQILVDKDDSAFMNPTKPIGSFYTKEEADKLRELKGYIMKEDSGRGYRRVVPSPRPVEVVEKELIKDLVNGGVVVISCGGGGIPVILEDNEMKGISAVVDKDFAAEKLAETVDADALLILTAVDKVCINFKKPNEKELDKVTLKELKKYIKEEQFGVGSMLPKVEACKKFVEHDKKKIAIIASLSKVKEALMGISGTRIVY